MIHAEKATLLLALLLLPAGVYAAPPEFQIDLKELDRQTPAAAQKPAPKPAPAPKPVPRVQKQAPKKKEPAAKVRQEQKKEQPAPAGDYVRYTIKPGDHIFKILVGRFGMSNDAAERLVPEIVELNEIKNIKTLEVGRTLLLPAAPLHGHEGRPARKDKEKETKKEKGEAPAAKATSGEGAKQARKAPADAPRASEPVVAAPRAPEPAAAASRAPAPAAEVPRAPEPAAPVPAPVPVQKAAPQPKSAPAPAPRPVPAPSAKPAPPPETKQAPPPQPAPAAPSKAAPPVALPAPPAIPQATTWVCQVVKHDTAVVVDSVLNALSATWSRNKIINSAAGAATPFSIRVDRYFEYKGGRYIVSIAENDPYNYTLIRILETAGYRVLMLTGKEDFRTVAEKLFKSVGIAADFGSHALQEGKQATGFLVQQDDAGGRRVLITNTAPPPGHKWLMPAGCAAR